MGEIRTMPEKSNIFMVAAVLILLGLGFLGWQLMARQYLPVDPTDTDLIDVHIPPASSATNIAALLKTHDLIRNERVFLVYCRQENCDDQLKAGHYRLSRSQGLAEIVQTITAGQVITATFTIPEGYTVAQIGELLISKDMCDKSSWQEALTRDYQCAFLKGPRPDTVRYPLEGFLFPDTYVIEESTPIEEIVRIMLDRFETVWNEEFAGPAQDQNRDLMEVVTTASLIEREAQVDGERPQISGVIKNRLAKGMLLQIDATVLYSLETNKSLVTLADLKVNSPYNTYIYPGLPPGPISCPGQAALRAALAPEDHHYYYYVARGDGSHEFTATFAEHLAAQRRYAQ